jgi:hypothetical protein
VEQQGQIVAHAGVWPKPLRPGKAIESCAHLIDWGASAAAAGAGIGIYRHLMDMCGSVVAIGGSAKARRLLPRIGFQARGAVGIYGRVVRPWRQFRTRPKTGLLRDAARLLRNSAWTFTNPHPANSGTVHQVIEPLTEMSDLGRPTAEILDYILQIPVATCSLYRFKSTVVPGYFLLSATRGQCRIADIFVDSQSISDWREAYRLALAQAAAAPDTCEITVFGSLGWVSELLEDQGFRKRDELPVMVFDPSGRLSEPLHLQMIDSDYFFRFDPVFPYLT